MKNIDHYLRQFVSIAQTGSVSGAADVLGLTQSGLSKQLSSLESFLGQRLFERHGRGVRLTNAGQKLLTATQSAYDLIDGAVVQLREEQGLTEGRLSVATIHPLSYYFMTDVVAKFMAQRPSVSVTLFGRSSPEVVSLVETSKADIGFVYDEAVASEELNKTFLFEESMCLIVHNTSPLAAQSSVDLREQSLPLVVFPPHYSLRRMLRTDGLDANSAAEVETMDAMLNLVSLSSGQCVLPDRIPNQLLQDHSLARVPIRAPILRRRVVAITRKGRPETVLSGLMLEIAQSAAD